MNSVRNWAARSAIAALLLLSPAITLLTVIAAETVIDFATETGRATVCFVAAGAIGWVLYRKRSPHPELAAQSGREQEPDQAAIATPPM